MAVKRGKRPGEKQVKEMTRAAMKYSKGGYGKRGSKHAINLMGAAMTGAKKRMPKRKK